MQNSRKHNKKSIRSFVKRSGRLTKSQKNALQDYSSNYILDTNNTNTDLKASFDSDQHNLVIEIGFGDGAALIESALKYPDKNFIGIEVYDSGLGQCLNAINQHKIKNIRLIYSLNNSLPNKVLKKLTYFFLTLGQKKDITNED